MFGVVLGAGGLLLAQIESNDRVVAPIDTSSNYEVTGVTVDIAAKDAETARMLGWREAQRKGWRLLYARLRGVSPEAAPALPDGTLDGIVAGIAVEDEQIGPRRYIARLGILFDRARAGALVGVAGEVSHSAPMLVIPVQYSGGALTSLEARNAWQEAWARFRPSSSPIDYVRPSGAGADPLLLNAGQALRRGRSWWRMLLDQYGAADVVVPEVRLTRAWPGGPVQARFVARHGPDGEAIDSFTLQAPGSAGLQAMIDEGVHRIDDAYAAALRDGRLGADRSLNVEQAAPAASEDLVADDAPVEAVAPAEGGASYIVQVETPDAAALAASEQALRSVPGVRSAATTSMALGGISVMRVAYDGDLAGLRLSLAARGWRVDESGGTLRIRRQPAAAAPDQATGGSPRQ